MKNAAPTTKTRRFAGPAAVAATLALGATVLVPGTAHAAGAGGSTTEHAVVVTDATGAPLAGQAVEITGTWSDKIDTSAYDAAQAAYAAKQNQVQAWFDAQPRPAKAAYDAAYQAYQAGTGTLAAWMATLPAQSQEMQATQARFEKLPLAQEQRAAGIALSEARAAMNAAATETRTLSTDANGTVHADPLLMGGGASWPTAQVAGDDEITQLPWLPSATTTIVLD